MILPSFELHRPRTVDEAIAMARDSNGDFDYMAGGTDLLPNYKNRLNSRKNVISLVHIEELRGIDGERIGAGVRLADLERDPVIAEHFPVLTETCGGIASPLIRESGTVGGNLFVETRCFYFNQSLSWRRSKGYCMKADGDVCLVVPQKEICYAAYSGDLAPVLMVLGATLHLRGFDGDRAVPIADFYRPDGILKNVLKRGEILTHVEIPPLARDLRSGYSKLRVRDAFDFPELGVAAALRLSGSRVAHLRIAASAMDVVPLRFDEITEEYVGHELTPETVSKIVSEVVKKTRPVKNTALPPQYRKRVFPVYLTRLLSRLREEQSA